MNETSIERRREEKGREGKRREEEGRGSRGWMDRCILVIGR